MIDGYKVINTYTDCFGNEIDEYEQIPRYSISYIGYLFHGDCDGLNCHDEDDWDHAYSIYCAYPDAVQVYDRLTGMTLSQDSWG